MGPGHIKESDLWNVNERIMNRYLEKIIPFFIVKDGSVCLDLGVKNPKMEAIKMQLKIYVDQADNINFNSGSLVNFYKKYDHVFALDIVEHIQNALFFVGQISRCIKPDGSIYISMPHNPIWLWPDTHYFEMSPRHFKKWILDPLDLKIIRHSRIYFINNVLGIFIGIRPLIRVLKGENNWKSLLRVFIPNKIHLYEIKRNAI